MDLFPVDRHRQLPDVDAFSPCSERLPRHSIDCTSGPARIDVARAGDAAVQWHGGPACRGSRELYRRSRMADRNRIVH